MEHAIEVQGLGKRFRRYRADRPTTLQEAVVQGLRRPGPADTFWALRDVTFDLPRGHMLGIIGANGAGKSTLLRLIAGVGRPDEGEIRARGRVGGLLDLGAGFHPDLTGRENVFINGVIGGLTRRQVRERLDDIVAFAELEDFIDNPLRAYSTGMRMRLAFAIAAHIEPEILLIDEVLAVGDAHYQHKCLDRIARFRDEGHSILLVSHDLALLRRLCHVALWLRAGRVIAHGNAHAIVERYMQDIEAETRDRTPGEWPVLLTSQGTELRVNENRFGSLELQITDVRLLDGAHFPAHHLASGDPLRVEIDYEASRPGIMPIFGVTITREDGLLCYDTSTPAPIEARPPASPGRIILDLERLDLGPGTYYIDVGAYQAGWEYAYDYHWHAYTFSVTSCGPHQGILRPPYRWTSMDGEQSPPSR